MPRPSLSLGWLLALCLMLLPAPALAQRLGVDQVANPRLSGQWVSDQADILSAGDEDALNRAIDRLHQAQGVEIAVVSVPDVDAPSPKDFATALFNAWGIGQEGKDNGLLVLMVMDQRRLEMETGYGLEGTLPDTWLKRMQVGVMVPHFKEGNFGQGIKDGVKATIARLSTPEAGVNPLSSAQHLHEEPEPSGSALALLALLFGGLAGLLTVGGGLWGWKRRKDRQCPQCKNRMQMVPDHEDDAYLDAGQQAEEGIGSIDYQFWYCTEHNFNKIIPVKRWLSRYSTCPSCKYRTGFVLKQQLEAPTYSASGLEEITEQCAHCDHRLVTIRHLPKLASHTSSSSSLGGGSFGGGGGGSFGGGSSGGGGAGSSW